VRTKSILIIIPAIFIGSALLYFYLNKLGGKEQSSENISLYKNIKEYNVLAIIDDFEDGKLDGWEIENRIKTPDGKTYPRITRSDKQRFPSHLDEQNIRHYLELYSGQLYGSANEMCSLSRVLRVPEGARYLVLIYNHFNDDMGHGYCRFYLATTPEKNVLSPLDKIVKDSGWNKPNYKQGKWNEYRFNISSLRGAPCRLWIGIRDEGDTRSGNTLYIDEIFYAK